MTFLPRGGPSSARAVSVGGQLRETDSYFKSGSQRAYLSERVRVVKNIFL
jgi:hypothetical protein